MGGIALEYYKSTTEEEEDKAQGFNNMEEKDMKELCKILHKQMDMEVVLRGLHNYYIRVKQFAAIDKLKNSYIKLFNEASKANDQLKLAKNEKDEEKEKELAIQYYNLVFKLNKMHDTLTEEHKSILEDIEKEQLKLKTEYGQEKIIPLLKEMNVPESVIDGVIELLEHSKASNNTCCVKKEIGKSDIKSLLC
jgi:hypothetical protein